MAILADSSATLTSLTFLGACKPKVISEDLSTLAGSDDVSSIDDGSSSGGCCEITPNSDVQGLLQSWSDDNDFEPEEGAEEESEFSLDGRLAMIKRWRAFRSRTSSAQVDDTPLLPLLMDRPPGMPPYGSTSALYSGLPGHLPSCNTFSSNPPGLMPDENSVASIKWDVSDGEVSIQHGQQHFNPECLNVINVEAGRLVETAAPWLIEQIRTLSLESLEVDAWEALAKPLPEDPEWQVVALVGCGGIVGFGTYAFFAEDHGHIVSVHHFVVCRTCRGFGCGRKLISDLIRRARNGGAWAVKLHSLPASIGFYQRAGFSIIGPDHLMELPIPS